MIGKPGMLQFMESQRIIHNLATEQQQRFCFLFFFQVEQSALPSTCGLKVDY